MKPARPRHWLLEQETRALHTRLARVKPFVLHETMVLAAAVSHAALTAIESYLEKGRKSLRTLIQRYLSWLRGAEGQGATPADAQRKFSILKLRFNAVLTQFDIFAIVMTQRSEQETGVWLAGLDIAATDALYLPGHYESPPVVCYLDRGHGAAIRRARTRLPGGGENPCAIIKVPRERMIGSGIGSSLIHEVGHQAAALLDLVASLRGVLQKKQGGEHARAWQLWERWISEIVADFWSVARLGICATTGLIGVVSLPRFFVFRIDMEDPHPFPWIRAKLSCAVGNVLYPHPQWGQLDQTWESYYPRAGLGSERLNLIEELEATMPEFIDLVLEHRPAKLGGTSLLEALDTFERTPERLIEYFQEARSDRRRLAMLRPCLAFAVLGQARANGGISPEEESRWIGELLTAWALRNALEAPATCAKRATSALGMS